MRFQYLYKIAISQALMQPVIKDGDVQITRNSLNKNKKK